MIVPLVRTELRRVRVRRLTRWLLALAGVGIVLTGVVSFATHHRASEAERVAEARSIYGDFGEVCAGAEGADCVPYEPTDEELLIFAPDPNMRADAVWRPDLVQLPGGPADPGSIEEPDQGEGGAVIAASFIGWLLAFVLATSLVGSEFRHGSIENQLLWEPRGGRVGVVKLAVGGLAGAVLAGVVIAGVVVSLIPSLLWRGSTAGLDADFWVQVAAAGGRGTVTAMILAVLGAALALLTRNAAAALGSVVALLLAELVVRVVANDLSPWLFFTNLRSVLDLSEVARPISPEQWPLVELGRLSPIHHGPQAAVVVVAAYVALFGTVAVWRFARNDMD